MSHALELTDQADDEIRKAILAPLVQFNDSQVGPSQGRPLVITLKADSGEVLGGLWGYTGYSWLFTQLLVVPASLRGNGIGTKLMAMAEQEALNRGCTGAWLDTFEFQARRFYEGIGYSCFGELQDYPPGYSRFFLKKTFTATAP
jgi:GNAT superfamily N-acetyltransferase